jgi:5-methylcytosine-specific restriction endonuclease McrA
VERRKALRSRSKKTARTYRTERIPLVIAMLEAHPMCQRCTQCRSSEVHEIKSRARGGSITDPDNVAALCHECHAWITTHPAAAHAEGWLKHSWE